MHSGRGPYSPVYSEQFVSTEPVVPEMFTVTRLNRSGVSEYEDSVTEYDDSDVDWEEWRDHPDREFWQDWQDAWMSQDPRYLEQEIHSSDTPISLLLKLKFKVEKIIESIHDNINKERLDIRSTIPELRNRGQRLLQEYMDKMSSKISETKKANVSSSKRSGGKLSSSKLSSSKAAG